MTNRINQLEVIHCEETFILTLEEITRSFSVSNEIIFEIIDEGIIQQDDDNYQQWKFNHNDVAKIRMVLQLEQDLGVNIAGAALALELMKKIKST